MAKKRQIAHLFNEVGNKSKKDLGGKGHGLVIMTRSNLPVPPGFVIETGVSRAFRQEGKLPKRLAWQLKRAIARLERQTGKQFGSAINPLLVSVRSGAPVSMPGMMDTVLNLGMTTEAVKGLVAQTQDEQFALDTLNRFEQAYMATVLGGDSSQKIPSCPWEQLNAAIEAVCRSWGSERAVAYRRAHNIPERLGTAIVVQAMVFGNASGLSGTGVVFSRNVATGEPGLYGEFLPNAQGEDVVAGVVTPKPIEFLKLVDARLYEELNEIVGKLEVSHNDVVDVEFTIEQGKLYILQVRAAKRTPVAAVKIAVDMVAAGHWTRKKAVAQVSSEQLEALQKPQFVKDALESAAEHIFTVGLPASGGSAVGRACFSAQKAVEWASMGESVVLVTRETRPEDFSGMLASVAIVTSTGGQTSHAAVVARGLGRPAVVGASSMLLYSSRAVSQGVEVKEGDVVSVDGTTGTVYACALPLVGSVASEKVKTFLSWVNEFNPKPTLDFELANSRWSANYLLNDFYLSSALQIALEKTDLGAEARKLHAAITKEVANVFAVYLFIAVAGEIRHIKARSQPQGLQTAVEIVMACLNGNPGADRLLFVDAVKKHINGKHVTTLEFVKMSVDSFRGGRWAPNYGGLKWSVIAETLFDYLTGAIAPVLFVDRAFDLKHNGGVMFNKHAMLEASTQEGRLQWQLEQKKQQDAKSFFAAMTQTFGSKAFKPEVQELFQKWRKTEEANEKK